MKAYLAKTYTHLLVQADGPLLWITLDLDYTSFTIFSQNTAPCRTLSAGRSVPCRTADHHVIRMVYE